MSSRHIGFIKAYWSTISPYLMKTNPFCCVVDFDTRISSKNIKERANNSEYTSIGE